MGMISQPVLPNIEGKEKFDKVEYFEELSLLQDWVNMLLYFYIYINLILSFFSNEKLDLVLKFMEI
jgi:hypothetical protein